MLTVPFGSEVVVIDTGVDADPIVMLSAALAVTWFASVTVTVKVAGPAAVGVPVIAPLEAIVKPAGSAPPVTANVYGAVPFVAATLAVYAAFIVPLGSVVVVIETGVTSAATLTVKFALAFTPPASVTVIVKLELPAAVGVPVIAPPEASVSPAGSVPLVTAKLYGVVPLIASTVAVYAAPTVPAGKEFVTIDTGVAAATTFSESVALAVPLLPSVTVTTKLEVPAAVGVPSSTPFFSSVTPAGSDPLVNPKL